VDEVIYLTDKEMQELGAKYIKDSCQYLIGEEIYYFKEATAHGTYLTRPNKHNRLHDFKIDAKGNTKSTPSNIVE
jgi:hypothetical protein